MTLELHLAEETCTCHAFKLLRGQSILSWQLSILFWRHGVLVVTYPLFVGEMQTL